MGEGSALAWPFPMTCGETTTTVSPVYLHTFHTKIDKMAEIQTGTSSMALTFEGSPDREVSQGEGMSNQEGPQGKGLIQVTQSYAQSRLTTQMPSTELQPVVDLQVPDSSSNK